MICHLYISICSFFSWFYLFIYFLYLFIYSFFLFFTELRRLEDLGLVAEHLGSRVRTLAPPSRLSIHRVFSRMQQIAACSGKSAQLRKQGLIRELLVAAKGPEARFIIRFLQQRMRVGCGAASVYQVEP